MRPERPQRKPLPKPPDPTRGPASWFWGVGGGPRRAAAARQRFLDFGAALQDAGRRDRYRGAAAKNLGLRRGQGAGAGRRCSRGQWRARRRPRVVAATPSWLTSHPGDDTTNIRFEPRTRCTRGPSTPSPRRVESTCLSLLKPAAPVFLVYCDLPSTRRANGLDRADLQSVAIRRSRPLSRRSSAGTGSPSASRFGSPCVTARCRPACRRSAVRDTVDNDFTWVRASASN